MSDKKTGVELIAEERKRQIEKHGYSATHDALHSGGQLIEAAKAYLDPFTSTDTFSQGCRTHCY